MASECPCCLSPAFPVYVDRNSSSGAAGGWVGCGACGRRATPVHDLICMHPDCASLSAFSLASPAGHQNLGYYCRAHCSDEAARVRFLMMQERDAAAAARTQHLASRLAAAAAAAAAAGTPAG